MKVYVKQNDESKIHKHIKGKKTNKLINHSIDQQISKQTNGYTDIEMEKIVQKK